MGCNGGKASAPTGVEPAKSTLLDASAQKISGAEVISVAAEPANATLLEESAGPDNFTIFMANGAASCFEPTEDFAKLRVKDVQGGAVACGFKVRKGDFVLRVRKADITRPAWVAGDAKLMLEALTAEGPFEVEIKRAMPEVSVELQPEPVEEPREALPAEAEEAAEAQDAVAKEACVTTFEAPADVNQNQCSLSCF